MAVFSNDTAMKMAEYKKTTPPIILPDSGTTRAFLVEILIWWLEIPNEIVKHPKEKRIVSAWPYDDKFPTLPDIMTIINNIDDISSYVKQKQDRNGNSMVSIEHTYYEDMTDGVIGYGEISYAEKQLLHQLKHQQTEMNLNENEKKRKQECYDHSRK